jgi:DNA segregation ATPase FtsK/SpoIIIE-like protein
MATPPVLVAGLTGSGKSTLMLLLSLAMSTPPAALEIHLVDLKNEDLVSLQALPPHARPGQHAGTGRRRHGALFPL